VGKQEFYHVDVIVESSPVECCVPGRIFVVENVGVYVAGGQDLLHHEKTIVGSQVMKYSAAILILAHDHIWTICEQATEHWIAMTGKIKEFLNIHDTLENDGIVQE
jgi:hypothetical protein